MILGCFHCAIIQLCNIIDPWCWLKGSQPLGTKLLLSSKSPVFFTVLPDTIGRKRGNFIYPMMHRFILYYQASERTWSYQFNRDATVEQRWKATWSGDKTWEGFVFNKRWTFISAYKDDIFVLRVRRFFWSRGPSLKIMPSGKGTDVIIALLQRSSIGCTGNPRRPLTLSRTQ